MRRSYFSNIVAPTHSPMVLPPRPIATLWKAARLDRLSEEKGMPPPESERGSIDLGDVRKNSRSKPVLYRGSEKDDSPVRSRPGETAFLPKQMSASETDSPNRSRSRTTVDPGNSQIEARQPLTSAESRSAAEVAPRGTGRQGEKALAADVIAGRQGTREFVLPAGLQKRSTLPTGQARSEPGHGAVRNMLHIGKIEVQIAPRQAPVRPAPPVKSRSRLARGYTLWTNWQQQ
jgi:hypothetical protein